MDRFRNHLPDQFIHAGISEQNMIDLASGLALSGKKVFLYAMAPFITARCYEQIKSVLKNLKKMTFMLEIDFGPAISKQLQDRLETKKYNPLDYIEQLKRLNTF